MIYVFMWGGVCYGEAEEEEDNSFPSDDRE